MEDVSVLILVDKHNILPVTRTGRVGTGPAKLITSMNRRSRPVYLNLLEFRFPATAVSSLLHRISGVLLFMALPFLIYGLERSLQGGEGMAQLRQLGESLAFRLTAALMAWALLHHWLAGWRFLFTDIDLGAGITTARRTARLLNVISLTGLLILGGIAL